MGTALLCLDPRPEVAAPALRRIVLTGLMTFTVGATFVLVLGAGEWGKFVLSLLSLGGSVTAALLLHNPEEPSGPNGHRRFANPRPVGSVSSIA